MAENVEICICVLFPSFDYLSHIWMEVNVLIFNFLGNGMAFKELKSHILVKRLKVCGFVIPFTYERIFSRFVDVSTEVLEQGGVRMLFCRLG